MHSIIRPVRIKMSSRPPRARQYRGTRLWRRLDLAAVRGLVAACQLTATIAATTAMAARFVVRSLPPRPRQNTARDIDFVMKLQSDDTYS